VTGKRKKPMAPARVSEEDKDLWRHATREAKPLAGRTPPSHGDTPQAEAPQPAAKPKKPRPIVRVTERPAPPPPELAAGALADVDKRTADRLKRGKLDIEGRLDLHGMTEEEARREVGGFLAEAQGAGKRCVLIITGKGPGREGGVLRRALPQWLNQPGNRARLVAFAPAQPRHGGHGAVYLLLKRTRGT
jgi:DNA-nicking Smr family endonuclease